MKYVHICGRFLACIFIVLVLWGCGGAAPTPSARPSPSILLPTISAGNTNAPCHYNYIGSNTILPDGACTPGVINPQVTQDNIDLTICRSGYTKTVRPPASYTDKLKVQQMISYGLHTSTNNVEEDHLIALEIGGNPIDPSNLWPELRGSTNAALKDAVENAAHKSVCSRQKTLAEVQQAMAMNWYALGQSLGVIKVGQ